jgi:hypothetical protein
MLPVSYRIALPVALAGIGFLFLAAGWEQSLGYGFGEAGAAVYVMEAAFDVESDDDALTEEVCNDGDLGLMLQLPTSNDALLRGDEGAFFQNLEATIPGLRRYAWEGGRYGFVRNQARTPAGRTFTRVHQGVDIRPVYRDARGVPLDTVRTISDGTVVYVNRNANGSNYGRYVVVRHEWDGTGVFSLFAHLEAVWVQRGAQLAAGDPIGQMGYTGRGINRQRAHVHLEVALMLNRHYNRWHADFYRGRNPHGLYMGRNLMGVDPAALFLALQEEPELTFAEFVRRKPVAYRLALPGDRPIDLLERYPWLAAEDMKPEDLKRPGAWVISFTREGVPVEIARQEASVAQPEVVYVSEEVKSQYLSTAGVLARTSNGYELTRHGRAFAALLATTPASTPRWF